MFEEMTGTRPMSQGQAFNVDALDRYLSEHVDSYRTGDLLIEQFKGGQSNPTYKLTTHGKQYVLRTKPGLAAKLLPSAHAIEREFHVLNALHDIGFPAARQYVLCTDESVIGRAFYLMEYIEGRVLWDPSLPGLSPPQRRAIYDEMNRVIAQLHTVDYAAIGLADFGKPGNYFARQIERWTRQYRSSQTETIEAMDQLIDWLPQHIPPADTTPASDCSIVHGDFRMDNLLFHPTEPRILAVLDWELSTLGHPAADFSYHCMSWYLHPGVFRGLAGLDLLELGIPSREEYMALYCERTGKHIREQDFNFYLAYNLFRLAGIMQGIMKRNIDGIAVSARAHENGKAARAMADLGWHYAQQT